jgi:hypothetical protein
MEIRPSMGEGITLEDEKIISSSKVLPVLPVLSLI